jgi:hypothetical protein
MKNSRWWIAALVVGLGVAGCGERTLPKESVYPAHGKVTLNGKPVQLAQIELHPVTPGQGLVATGIISSGGTFALRTYSNTKEPDGAVPGKYKVIILGYDGTVMGPAPKGVTPTKIPAKYGEAGSSDQTVEVKAGPNNLKIDLVE